MLPASADDPLVTALQSRGRALPLRADRPRRCGPTSTITEQDGTTTKLNEPGAMLDEAALDALTRAVVERAERATGW